MKPLLKTTLLIVLLTLITSAPTASTQIAHAQSGDRIVFDHLTVENGLSFSEVRVILQDDQGFMWIATTEGLNRYDGYNFTVYKNDITDLKSLSRNHIQAMVQDNQDPNIFWIGTLNGLNKFDRRTEEFTRYLHDPDDPTSIGSNDIMGFAQEPSGLLWIATWDAGINRLDPATGIFTRIPPPPENPDIIMSIRGFVREPNGTLWIGSDNYGLIKLDPQAETYTHFPSHRAYFLGRGDSQREQIIKAAIDPGQP